MVAGQNKRRKSIPGKAESSDSHLVEAERSLDGTIFAQSIEVYEQALNNAFDKRRDFYVHTIVSKLREMGLQERAVGGKDKTVDWLEIESLSKLRSIVGGRFQNIKAKWTNAGFPLKEHRGDKVEQFDLNKGGWIELTNWILSQGFEARLASNGEQHLFEIRPVRNDV